MCNRHFTVITEIFSGDFFSSNIVLFRSKWNQFSVGIDLHWKFKPSCESVSVWKPKSMHKVCIKWFVWSFGVRIDHFRFGWEEILLLEFLNHWVGKCISEGVLDFSIQVISNWKGLEPGFCICIFFSIGQVIFVFDFSTFSWIVKELSGGFCMVVVFGIEINLMVDSINSLTILSFVTFFEVTINENLHQEFRWGCTKNEFAFQWKEIDGNDLFDTFLWWWFKISFCGQGSFWLSKEDICGSI